MSRFKLGLTAAGLACAVGFGFYLENASAASCGLQVSLSGNTGKAYCGSGSGYVRAYVNCTSGQWPYTGTVWGNTVWSANGNPKSQATCPAGSWVTGVGGEVSY